MRRMGREEGEGVMEEHCLLAVGILEAAMPWSVFEERGSRGSMEVFVRRKVANGSLSGRGPSDAFGRLLAKK